MPSAVTLQLNEETLSGLDELSARLSRPREELVSEALRDWLVYQRELIEKIEDGIAAADRGEFVSQGEIERIVGKHRTAD